MFLVTHVNVPGKLKNAENSSFIRSPQLPSPMGKYITAISPQSVEQMLKDYPGSVYSWEELFKNYEDLPQITTVE